VAPFTRSGVTETPPETPADLAGPG
jgi:hypothetical protein